MDELFADLQRLETTPGEDDWLRHLRQGAILIGLCSEAASNRLEEIGHAYEAIAETLPGFGAYKQTADYPRDFKKVKELRDIRCINLAAASLPDTEVPAK